MANITYVDTAYVRQWAREKGLFFGTRGHLPEEVIEAFNKAHKVKRYRSKNPSTLQAV